MGYRGKLAGQDRARQLRARGWTLAEIAAEIGVSKASASIWTRDVEIDSVALAERRRRRWLDGNHGARRRIPNALQRRKQIEIERLQDEGRQRIGRLTEREFLVAGLALYAGEGSKTDGDVKLANSDPLNVSFFLSWLRRFFDLNEHRLRLTLYLHQGLDLDQATRFWVDLTGIPASRMRKPYRAVPDPSIRRSKHPLGCASVALASVSTHRAITGMIAALLSCDTSFRGSSAGRATGC
jgi:hypothetical protein